MFFRTPSLTGLYRYSFVLGYSYLAIVVLAHFLIADAGIPRSPPCNISHYSIPPISGAFGRPETIADVWQRSHEHRNNSQKQTMPQILGSLPGIAYTDSCAAGVSTQHVYLQESRARLHESVPSEKVFVIELIDCMSMPWGARVCNVQPSLCRVCGRWSWIGVASANCVTLQ